MKDTHKIFGLVAWASLATLSFTSTAVAVDFEDVKAKLELALQAEGRPDADKDRDRNRRPIDTLEFFGLRDDMKVVELIPGGGWYTRLLAPVLAEHGEFYIAYGTSRVAAKFEDLPGFEKLKVTAEGVKMGRPEGAKYYEAKETGLGLTDVDMVFTFRNYHNFDAASRDAINNSVFVALKSGGVYALVDHTRRHMQKDDNENGRRVDPVLAIKEIEAAGFVFVDYSDLHYRADDELIYEVGRKTVKGNTDRWTLKFRKP